jgi:hypothetical protein
LLRTVVVACTRNATMLVMFLDTRLVCFERRRAGTLA